MEALVPAGENENTIVVERADRALVVRSSGARTGAAVLAAALPPEPARTTVVVDASAAEALHALDDRLLVQLKGRLDTDSPPGWEMRLVAARAARPDPSGAPPLAARLADRLGVGVVAPDGELIALRGGELFSAGPGAGWLGFRGGHHPEWAGPRYPEPTWQAALPREFRSIKPRPLSRIRGRDRGGSARPVTVTAIPSGLWVRAAGTAPLPLVDLGFGVPVEYSRPVVLVGAPGEPTPGVAELAAFYESLPPALREIAVLVPYGRDPEACAELAQRLADRLDVAIHAYHALPHYATDGTRRFAVFNAMGKPDRLSHTPENVYRPAGAAPPPPAPNAAPAVHEPGLMEMASAADEYPAGGPAGSASGDFGTDAAGDWEPGGQGPGDWGPGDGEVDDFDAGDPVVFEVSMGAPARPESVLDAGAPSMNRDDAPRTTAMVTVDAQGVLRPLVTVGRQPILPPGLPDTAIDVTVEPASLGPWPVFAGAGEPVESVPGHDLPDRATILAPTAGNMSAALRTTASTVLPRTRPATRSVAVPRGWRETAPAEPNSPASSPRPETTPGEPWGPGAPPAGRADPAETIPDTPRMGPRAAPEAGSPAPVSAAPAPSTEATAVTVPAVDEAMPNGTPSSEETVRLPTAETLVVRGADARPESADAAPSPDHDRRWLADRVSTPEDRRAFRTSLGWRYDAATRSVARLLAESPGLRSAGEVDEALMTELAAVRVFMAQDQADLVESIRLGGRENDRALAACVAGGLRRLPSLQGIVVRGGPAEADAADAYRPGQELVEAAPLIALDDVGAHVPGAVEILIWSATARRLNGFADDQRTPEVAFLPGTVFRVLAVDPPQTAEGPDGTAPVRRVLLTEVPQARSGPGQEKWADRVLTRLDTVAAARTASPPAEPGEPDEPAGRFTPLPGDPARLPIGLRSMP